MELTPEEQEQALNKAKQEKHRQLQIARKNQEYEQRLADCRTPFTPEQLWEFIMKRIRIDTTLGLPIGEDGEPEFKIDDNNSTLIRALCYYHTGDTRFENFKDADRKPLGWKLNKGIMLMGDVGTGKTTIMKLFEINKRQSYTTISCRKVAGQFADTKGIGLGAHEILQVYSRNTPNSYMDMTYFLQKERGYCFDDLGTEETKKNFGNEVDVMKEILLNRYDNKQATWNSTHITTNLSADEIEGYYGARVRSRMREMFNMIILKGADRRK